MKVFTACLAALAYAVPAGAADPEIVHLPATELAKYHVALAQKIKDEPRTEIYRQGGMSASSPFPESEDRNHYFSVLHRSGYSYAESHDVKNDIYVVIAGAGTLLLGGEMQQKLEVPGRPGEWRSPKVKGGKKYPLVKGDLINVPAKVPHQWLLSDDESISYVIVKVLAK